MPWHTTGAPGSFPRNAASRKPYRGINTLILAATAQQHGYPTGLWGTFNQWRDLGAQVHKGEKAAQIVFWKITRSAEEEEDRAAPAKQVLTRPYHVFNAAQVRGYTPPATPRPLRRGASHPGRAVLCPSRPHHHAWRPHGLLRPGP